jgi:oxygen-independent coproporphyrinogen III oxidase
LQASKLPLYNANYSLGLYVHIPFCAKKCGYCDFYSVPAADPGIQERILGETITELHHFSTILKNAVIDTIYIGGGTPSSVSIDLLDRFLGKIEEIASKDVEEWTIEANPESLSEDFLAMCDSHNITRISLGIQSLDPGSLLSLGRNASEESSRRALSLVRDRWRGEINVDIISGIPGQSRTSVCNDIRESASLAKPSHISFYSLTVEKGTPLFYRVRSGETRMLSETEQDDLWLTGKKQLEKLGYANYEISNFSKPGKECLHNMKYWQMKPYLGIGPGAVSTLPGKDGTVLRLENPKSFHAFLSGAEQCWGIELESVSPKDFLFENLMMGFRLEKGIDKEVFASRFGRSMEDLLSALWDKWRKNRIVKNSRDSYTLTEKARLTLNPILVELSEYLDQFPEEWPVQPLNWP